MEQIEVARLTGTIDWLEDEARQHKAAVARVQTQHDQLLAFVRDYVDQLRLVQDSISAIRGQVGLVDRLGDDLQRAMALINANRDAIVDVSESTARRHQGSDVEVDRLRGIVGETWQRTEQLRRDLDPIPARIQIVADNQKRFTDATLDLQQHLDNVKSEVNGLALRLQGMVDRDRRVDERFADISSDLEALHKRDDTAYDKQRILADRITSLEGSLAKLIAEEDERRKIDEQVQLHRLSLTRLDQRISEASARIDRHDEGIDDVGQKLKVADERREDIRERVDEHDERIQAVRDDLTELLADYETLEEQQRTRLVTELQQQIKEIKARVSKARNR